MNYLATNLTVLSHEKIGKKILENIGEENSFYPDVRINISKKIQDLLLEQDYQPQLTSQDYKSIEDEVLLGFYKEKYPNIQSMSDVEKVIGLEKEFEDINKKISQSEKKLKDIVSIEVPDFVNSSVFLDMKLEDFLSDSFFSIDSTKLNDDAYEEELFDKVKQSQILVKLFPKISVFRRASSLQDDFNFGENVIKIKEFFLKNSSSQSQTLGENIQYILSGEREKADIKKEIEELLSRKKMIDLQIQEFHISEKQSNVSIQDSKQTEENNFNIIKSEEVILATLHPEYKVDYTIYNRYKGVMRFDKTPIELPGEFLSEHLKRLLGDLYHGETIEFFAFIQELRSIYSDNFIHAALTNAVCNKLKSDPDQSIRFIFNNLDKMDDHIIKNFFDNMIANNGFTVTKKDLEGLTLDSNFFDFVIQHSIFFSKDALRFLNFRKSLQHHSRSEEIQQELGYDYDTVGKIIHGEGGKYSIVLADKFTRKLDQKSHTGLQKEAHFYLLHSYLDSHNLGKIRSYDFDARVGTKRLRMNIENNLAHFKMLDVFNEKHSNLNPEKNFSGPFSILSSLKNSQKESIKGSLGEENIGNEIINSENSPEIQKTPDYVEIFFNNDREKTTQSDVEIFLKTLWGEFLQLGQISLTRSIGKKEKGFESVPFFALLQTDNLEQYIDFLYYHFPETYKKEMEDMKKKNPYISNTELKYSIFHDHAKKFQSRLKKLESKFIIQKLSQYLQGVSSFQELQEKLNQDNNLTDLEKVVVGIQQENVKIKIYNQNGEGTLEGDFQVSDNYGKFSYLLIEMQKKGYDIQEEDIFVSKNDYYVCKIQKYNITLISSNNGGNIFLFPGFEMIELLEDETLRDLVEAYDGVEKRFNYDNIERSIGEILFLIENSPTSKNKSQLLKEFIDLDAEELNEMTKKSLSIFQKIFSQLSFDFENGTQLRNFITDWNSGLRNYTESQPGKYFNIIQSFLNQGYQLNDLYLKSFNNSSSKDLSENKIIQGLGGKQAIVLKAGYTRIVQKYLELLINDSQKARVFEGEFFRSIPKKPQINFLLDFIANNISETGIGELNAAFKNNCTVTFVNGLRMRRGSQGKTGMMNSLGNVLSISSGDVGNLLKVYSDRKKYQNEVFTQKLTILEAIALFGKKYKHTFEDVDHLGFFLKVNPYISEEEQNNQILINSKVQEILERLKQSLMSLYNKKPISQEEFILEFNNAYISPSFSEKYFPTYKKWKIPLSSQETQFLIDNISIVESFIGTHFHGEDIEGKTNSLTKNLKKIILDMVFLEIGAASNILGEKLTIEYKKSSDNSDDVDSEE